MNGRIIAIGDIHGCHQEFAELLQLLKLNGDDLLILLGDLVNRGPDSCKVIDLARKHNAISLLGNHELRLLGERQEKDISNVRESDRDTLQKLRPEDWLYLEAMPLTYEVPDLNTVFVHGGFLPNIPWQNQGANIVTRIQVINASGQPCKRADAPEALPWADLWNGPPYVVYGHTPREEVYKLKWSLCLDTACVMGGQLTAFILPERRIVQVKARRRYFP
ncbi:MAG: metallophosphoesterase [Cephaloticoccus sp.]|nr:metallophosphoesterase [Cephaloticoccus sp.]MCF7760237.1 metallophosphoesterase [Cephaloticoccus sp.]